MDPAGAAEYGRNGERLSGEIDTLFEGLGLELAPLRGKPVFVYHPAFGYFLDEFGIEQVAVQRERGAPARGGQVSSGLLPPSSASGRTLQR